MKKENTVDLILLLVLILVLLAVFGGLALHPLLFLILIVAAIVLLARGRA